MKGWRNGDMDIDGGGCTWMRVIYLRKLNVSREISKGVIVRSGYCCIDKGAWYGVNVFWWSGVGWSDGKERGVGDEMMGDEMMGVRWWEWREWCDVMWCDLFYSKQKYWDFDNSFSCGFWEFKWLCFFLWRWWLLCWCWSSKFNDDRNWESYWQIEDFVVVIVRMKMTMEMMGWENSRWRWWGKKEGLHI